VDRDGSVGSQKSGKGTGTGTRTTRGRRHGVRGSEADRASGSRAWIHASWIATVRSAPVDRACSPRIVPVPVPVPLPDLVPNRARARAPARSGSPRIVRVPVPVPDFSARSARPRGPSHLPAQRAPPRPREARRDRHAPRPDEPRGRDGGPVAARAGGTPARARERLQTCEVFPEIGQGHGHGHAHASGEKAWVKGFGGEPARIRRPGFTRRGSRRFGRLPEIGQGHGHGHAHDSGEKAWGKGFGGGPSIGEPGLDSCVVDRDGSVGSR
jgi:hypothetical protein